VRVCIMRLPEPTIDWDIWMPVLAPSLELLRSYRAGSIPWESFAQRFHVEAIQDGAQHVQLLVDMCQNRTITILCAEEMPAQCHRRLVAEACQRLRPDLPVVIL